MSAEARGLRGRLEDAWRTNDPAQAANDVRDIAEDAIVALDAALARVGESCTWTPMDEEAVSDWETACGRAWSFTEDGPTENRMDFCMGCGRRVATPAPAGTQGGG